MDLPYLESYYMTKHSDEPTTGWSEHLGMPKRERLDMVFRMKRPETHGVPYAPFQCRHVSPNIAKTELQWNSCFHDFIQNSPADVQIWWHVGECIDRSQCLCKRSKYPDSSPFSHVVSPILEPFDDLRLGNVFSGVTNGVVGMFRRWFTREEDVPDQTDDPTFGYY